MTHQKPQGFTLVETMVAITIVMLAIAGPFTVVQSSVNAAYVARDELIATSLAQEGLEFARNVRDVNYLNGQSTFGADGWVSRISSCFANATCMVDPNAALASQITICPSSGCLPLNIEGNANLNNKYAYNHRATSQTNTVSRFTRSLQLTRIAGSPNEVKLTVTVSWITARIPHTVTVTENITNWL
ncbi:MAG: seg [Parcubacteria group bacterium]|nr:seg [Parcubacteria group bacterium]